jgi:putative flippase GtrA
VPPWQGLYTVHAKQNIIKKRDNTDLITMNLKNLINKFWSAPYFRFLIVGGINTVFGYLVYALLIFLGLNYQAAILISTIIGIIFNFKTTGVLVFKNSDNRLFIKFFSVYASVYLINTLGVYLLKLLGFDSYAAGAIVTLPIAVLSYFLLNIFVYGPQS